MNSPGPPRVAITENFSGGVDAIFSYPLFRDLSNSKTTGSGWPRTRALVQMSRTRAGALKPAGFSSPGDYFTALGVTPEIGRLLGPQDDRVPGGHPVVVLSDEFWRTRFGADPGIVNRTLIVNGGAMTIVGVAPAGFRGITALQRPRIFVPLAMAEQAFRDPGWNGLSARNNHWLYLLGVPSQGSL